MRYYVSNHRTLEADVLIHTERLRYTLKLLMFILVFARAISIGFQGSVLSFALTPMGVTHTDLVALVRSKYATPVVEVDDYVRPPPGRLQSVCRRSDHRQSVNGSVPYRTSEGSVWVAPCRF